MNRLRVAGIVAALVVAIGGFLATGEPAFGHALPQSSDPGRGADLTSSPTAVTIVFGERPDPKLSTIRVLDTSGASVTSGPTSAVATDPLTLTVPVRTLGSGVYTVAWRTVSAVDGHLATGTFAFGVGVSPPASASSAGSSPTVASNGPSPASIVGRWLLYLGLIPLAGAAFFALASGTASRPLTRVVLPAAWAAAAVGTASVLAVEISDAGVGLGDLAGTSLGTAVIVRLVPLLVAAPGVLWVRRRPGRIGAGVVLIGGVGEMLADVAFSHAAAGGAAAFDMVVQAAHVLAVGLWLGGLVGLLVALRGEPGPETARVARRYAWFATAGIAVVAVSGLIRAASEVGTVDALVSTDFGRLVIAKTALLALLALLGAVNHFRNVPAAGRALRSLRRVGSVELLVGATVLLLSASLVNLAPPSEVAAAQGAEGSAATAPLVVIGADYGTSVRLRLEVSPGQAGFNVFRVTVTDYDTGALVAATGVTLRFTMPARSDLGGSRLDLNPVRVGVFSATGSNLSLDGIWQVTALVVGRAASVEVPLELTTRAPSPTPTQQIDVNAVAGLPTIYTVHLSAGRTVQVYLDPGTAGSNEVHATFFDATGTELPVPSVQISIGPRGGTLAPLDPRILEPGHFVADTTLVAGTYTLSVAGPAPGGDLLSTRLDIPVTK